jgi:hypothetical protein
MRTLLIALWFVAPAAGLAYHYGPGQTRLGLDDVDRSLDAARRFVEADQHAEAVELFDDALAKLPPERATDAPRIRVERAKSQLLAGQLPAAYDDLAILVPELRDDPATDPELLADAENTEANTRYYVTWLMRLEGEPRAEWEPEIEASRQTYRLLAERARAEGDEAAARRHEEDLEAAIRLARLDLADLQALPLPSQCRGCCSGDCQCKGKEKKKGNGRSMNKPNSDQFARGASSGPPPDEGGN